MSTHVEWYVDRKITSDAPMLDFKTITRHILIDSTHKQSYEKSYKYKVHFGVQGDESHASEKMKNIVSVNILNAEIPRTADNIIEGRNVFYIIINGNEHVVTLPPGLYLSSASYVNIIDNALNNLEVATFAVALLDSSRLKISSDVDFTLSRGSISTMDSVLFQWGIIDATGVDISSQIDSNDSLGKIVVSQRYTNMMPRSFVDIVIPEIPTIGTKLTNGPRVGRVMARIPLHRQPGGSQLYEPNESQLLRHFFSPISLTSLTVMLIENYGEPYDARDTPHTISLEVIQLGDPVTVPPKKKRPKLPEQVPISSSDTVLIPWWEDFKWPLLSVSAGALVTFWIVGRIQELIRNATSSVPGISSPGTTHRE